MDICNDINIWEEENENILEFTLIDFFNPTITEAKQELSDEELKEFEKMLKRNKSNNFSAKLKKSSGDLKEIFGIDLFTVGADIGKFAATKIKDNGFTQEAKDEINRYANKKYREISETIVSSYQSIDPGEISNKAEFQKYINDKEHFSKAKLTSAFNLLFKVLISCIIIQTILQIVFGPVGLIISTALVAPIMEENAKIVAVKGDFALEFSVVFNTFEFTEYVVAYGPAVGFGKMIAVRALVVGMHLSTTLVHYLSNNKTIVSKINNPKKVSGYDTDDEDVKATLLGKFLGTTIHMVWNTVAIGLSL